MSERTFTITYEPNGEHLEINMRGLDAEDVQAIRARLAGREFQWTLDREAAIELVRGLLDGLLQATRSEGVCEGHCMGVN